MKVKLKKDYPKKGWLTDGKIYHVLEVFFNLKTGVNSLRIVADEGTPILVEIEYFEILDEKINSEWVFSYSESHIEFTFREFQKEGFWEHYFDNDKSSIDAFNFVLTKLNSST